MKTTLNFILLYLTITTLKAQGINSTLPPELQKKLDDAKMSFKKPEGVTEIPVVNSGKVVNYDYALKMNDKNVEIRYAVRPIPQEVFELYEKREKKEGDTVLNPNIIHRMLTPMMYSAISGGKLTPKAVSIQYFKPEKIKQSAGADIGSMSAGPVAAEWAQGYNFGLFIMLHKDYLADAYIFYLFENEKQLTDAFKEITGNDTLLYALKFN